MEIEIVCNAPPYIFVQKSAEIGFQRPLDVRWERLGDAKGGRCLCCGSKLDAACEYHYSIADGSIVRLGMVQCVRCKTIYWVNMDAEL